jgi:hypothetical protein
MSERLPDKSSASHTDANSGKVVISEGGIVLAQTHRRARQLPLCDTFAFLRLSPKAGPLAPRERRGLSRDTF